MQQQAVVRIRHILRNIGNERNFILSAIEADRPERIRANLNSDIGNRIFKQRNIRLLISILQAAKGIDSQQTYEKLRVFEFYV